MGAVDSATRRGFVDVERARPVVMIVEDHPDQRRLYGALLWYNGFNVFLVPDAASALSAIRFLRPDLILLDLGLPDDDGLNICETLRRMPDGASIPVVALSSFTAREKALPSLEAGCIRFLEKSSHGPLAVLRVVEDVLGRAPPSGEGATSWMLAYPRDRGRADEDPAPDATRWLPAKPIGPSSTTSSPARR